MRDENTIVRERQLLIRREMDRRGIAIKAVQLDGGWKDPSTVLSYFPNPDGKAEPATMSVAALYRLLKTKALPAELLSMLLPDGHVIVRVPEATDYDEVADWAENFCARKMAAHRKDSEHAEQIGPNERAELDQVVVAFPGSKAA